MALIADFVTGKPVSFQRVRHLLAQMGLQEGVVGGTDLRVTQRTAGATMSVEVAVGEGWVAVDTGVRNGIAHLTNNAVANVVVPASDATNPTVHSVVAQYNDTAIPAGAGGDEPTLRLIAGTPTAGATLDNRNGAPGGPGGPGMPADSLLLGDVLVPASSTSVINANIRDRRRWARGLNTRQTDAALRQATTSDSGNIIGGAGTWRRVELSGAPLTITLEVEWDMSAATATTVAHFAAGNQNAFFYGGGRYLARPRTENSPVTSFLEWTSGTPSPGSFLITPRFWPTASVTLSVRGDVRPTVWRLREEPTQTADNG